MPDRHRATPGIVGDRAVPRRRCMPRLRDRSRTALREMCHVSLLRLERLQPLKMSLQEFDVHRRRPLEERVPFLLYRHQWGRLLQHDFGNRLFCNFWRRFEKNRLIDNKTTVFFSDQCVLAILVYWEGLHPVEDAGLGFLGDVRWKWRWRRRRWDFLLER